MLVGGALEQKRALFCFASPSCMTAGFRPRLGVAMAEPESDDALSVEGIANSSWRHWSNLIRGEVGIPKGAIPPVQSHL